MTFQHARRAFSYSSDAHHFGGTMDHDIIPAFLSAMASAGVKPTEPVADRLGSGLVRFHCEGDGKGKRNGWAVLHLDGRPAGAFGNYRLQVSETWRAGQAEDLSPAERREQAAHFRAEQERRAAAKRAEQEATALDCQRRWNAARVASHHHPYLQRKRIPSEGVKQEGARLLVPMRDDSGAIWNLQSIAPGGTKLFAKGGRQGGLFCLLGQPDGAVMIGEGFATCAAARRATGLAAAVAFSAKNLMTIALTIRDMWPDCDIVILADDDAHLIHHPTIKRNVGLDAAREAAEAVGGRVAIPPSGERTRA